MEQFQEGGGRINRIMMRVENVGWSETCPGGGLAEFATTVNTSLGLINPSPDSVTVSVCCATVRKYYLKNSNKLTRQSLLNQP